MWQIPAAQWRCQQSRSAKVSLLQIPLTRAHPLPSAALHQINLCLFKRRGISHEGRVGCGEVVHTTLLMMDDAVCLGYYSLY